MIDILMRWGKAIRGFINDRGAVIHDGQIWLGGEMLPLDKGFIATGFHWTDDGHLCVQVELMEYNPWILVTGKELIYTDDGVLVGRRYI